MARVDGPANRRLIGLLALVMGCVGVLAVAATPVPASEADDQAFVRAAYEGLLGRPPEGAGSTYWTGRLADGMTRTEVVSQIGASPEQRQRTVSVAYRELLDREPDGGGLAFWSGQVIERLGVAGIREQMLASAEFYQRAGGSNEGFVTELYRRLLGREADPGGEAFWLERLRNGVSPRRIARSFLVSAEALERSSWLVMTQPRAGSEVDAVDEIVLRFDRPIRLDSSGVIVSVDGERVPGLTTRIDGNDDSLRFVPTTRPSVGVGRLAPVVVTAFVYDGSTVERFDFDFSYRPRSTSIPPGDDLMIAFYGHPAAPVLGVGGEGTPAQALGRLLEQAAPYRASGKTLVPTFEMIATLVTAGPGDDQLYRARADESSLRAYLEVIRGVGGRLVLDIQPGRADVLDEARAHERLLLEPEVGLALDPEWVVGPTQTPSGRIGSLDAAEINRVSAYLAQLVESNDLPPKILIVHRFEADMVTNPDAIANPPGVRIIFQADGEGGPAAKIGDYDTLLPPRFERGIKIFYDEDTNRLTPEQVLARLDPLPVFVSYQ